jgi:ATP-dependent DNA helicase PIF1
MIFNLYIFSYISMKLTQLQQAAIACLERQENLFLTGPSGTGKSHVINTYVNNNKHRRVIAVTSTTGISAVLLGGNTLHSYLGIGLGNLPAEDLARKISRSSFHRNRWKKVETLIIDEVSMLSPDLFDKLDDVAKKVRQDDRPFGGIHLVLVGDFLQLPVVKERKFCFESERWPKCITRVINLTEIMRQDNNQLQIILNELRFGVVSEKAIELLSSRLGVNVTDEHGIIPTRLYTTNMDVDAYNEEQLDKLDETDPDGVDSWHRYEVKVNILRQIRPVVKQRLLRGEQYQGSEPTNESRGEPTITDQLIERWKKNSPVPLDLFLRKKAQVMLTANLDVEKGLANGSRGIVIDFLDEYPLVLFHSQREPILVSPHIWTLEEEGKPFAEISQVPLRLAWACTVHKSQGQTLDLAEIDLRNVFEFGQAYVALSRVRSLEGLSLLNINFDTIKAHPAAVKYYKDLDSY